MKPKSNISIKWKIYLYLIMFAFCVLLVLWLATVVFLQGAYRSITINKTISSAKSIAASVLANDGSAIQKTIDSGGISVFIADINGDILFSHSQNSSFALSYPQSKILMAERLCLVSGGSYLEYIDERAYRGEDESSGAIFDERQPTQKASAKAVLYVLRTQTPSGVDCFVFASTVVVPLDSAIDTIKTILLLTSAFTALAAVFAALLISGKISRPILRLNDGAKKLAMGNYDVKFTSGDYREVSELAATLNYTAVELKKIESLQRELIANVSHDLKTPLTLISGYAEMMRDLPQEATAENIEVIIDESRRLSGLVSDVLDISKLKSGTEELTCEKTELTELVNSALSGYFRLMEKTGVTIKFNYRENERIFVWADSRRLTQVIYNLINNAINYRGADNEVIVEIRNLGERVRLSVVDHGRGIKKEYLSTIWDRYYKDPCAPVRPEAGTGLGLSIVKSILDKHGFTYGVDSAEGRGSEFWFEAEIIS